MGVDLIFKIAATGILVAIVNTLLKKSDRDEYAFMVTLIGLIIVLLMVAPEISRFFNTIKSLFGF